MNKEYVLYGPKILKEEYQSYVYSHRGKSGGSGFLSPYEPWILEKESLVIKVGELAKHLENFCKYTFANESDMLLFKVKYPEVDWNCSLNYYSIILRDILVDRIKSTVEYYDKELKKYDYLYDNVTISLQIKKINGE